MLAVSGSGAGVIRRLTIVGSVSSSLKIRSEAAIADCRMLYFSLKILDRAEKTHPVLEKRDQNAEC